MYPDAAVWQGLTKRRKKYAAIDLAKQGSAEEKILDYLEPKLSRNPEKPVILYTDADAPYGSMVTVYDVLALAEDTRGFKVKNISVPTQTEIQEYIELFGFNPFEQSCQ